MFLRYLVALGIISPYIPLMLDKFTLSRMVFIEELTKENQESFNQNHNQILFSPSEFYTHLSMVDFFVEQQKYYLTMKWAFHKA